MTASGSCPAEAVRWNRGVASPFTDEVVVEEPLEIRLDGRRYTATMRTPGHDEFLTMGLLLAEGVIGHATDVERLELSTRCREGSTELVNVANVVLHDASAVPDHLFDRSLISNASCGLCGKSSVEALTRDLPPLPSRPNLCAAFLMGLSPQLRAAQQLFTATGGLHGAALFNPAGEMLACHEDIGRHNATDKVVGQGALEGWLPAHEPLTLLVSGRVSFEIVQKALAARVATVAAVSAASSLAVALAQGANLNLLGFLRGESFTVYHGQLENT